MVGAQVVGPRVSNTHIEVSLDQLNSSFISSIASTVARPSRFSFLPPVEFDPAAFYFSHITPDVLHKALLTCSTNTAGPDNINRRFVMDSLPITFPIILDLLNLSLDSSTFPSP